MSRPAGSKRRLAAAVAGARATIASLAFAILLLMAAAGHGRAAVLGMGAQAYRAWEHGTNGWGSAIALGFDAEEVRQFSARLADRGLGLVLRYTRVDLDELARVRGGEILARRRWAPGPERWRIFASAGLGMQEVNWSATGSERVIWNATLEGGLELRIGDLLRAELGLLTRSIEFSTDSFTGTALALTVGTRIDA
jgi:hypothetical protein